MILRVRPGNGRNSVVPKCRSASGHLRGGTPASAKLLVALLPLVIFVHALDRGGLANAAPLIVGELGYSYTAFGLLLSAYFWTYVPGQFLAGWAIDKWGAHRTLAAGLALFSLATILTGLSSGFVTLLGLRLMVGLGECASFPCSAKLITRYIPLSRISVPNAMIGAGLMLGNGAGAMLSGQIMASWGWRAIFYVFGALSLVMALAWTLTARRIVPVEAPDEREIELSYRAILGKRELWAASFGQFAFNYPYLLLLMWMPLYLVRAHGFSLQAMGLLGFAIYVLSAAMGLIIGFLADRRIAMGADTSRLRHQMLLAAGMIMITCMLACAFGTAPIAIAALLAYSIANGLSGVNTFAAGQTLAGPSAAGKWIAVQNGVGSVAGISAPIITGFIVDMTGYFQAAFLISALIVVVGTCCWTLAIKRIEPLRWQVKT